MWRAGAVVAEVALVVTDLDGTLLTARDQIHPRAVEAVRHVQDLDHVELMVATGRRFSSARRALAPYDVLPPAVLMAGAVGADLDTGEEWHRTPLPPQKALEALRILRAHDLEPVAYVGDAEIDGVAADGCASNPQHLAQFGGGLQRMSPDRIVAAGRCAGFGICGVHHDGLDAAAAALDGVAAAWLGPDHLFGGRTLMVGPPGVTKVSALQGWCDRHGIDRQQVLAIGDGSNDVDMLAWAGTAVAVEGGVTVDDPHDQQVGRPEDGGWADIVALL